MFITKIIRKKKHIFGVYYRIPFTYTEKEKEITNRYQFKEFVLFSKKKKNRLTYLYLPHKESFFFFANWYKADKN